MKIPHKFTIVLTRGEACLACFCLILLLLCFGLYHEARVAQEKSRELLGMMEKSLILPHSPKIDGSTNSTP